MRRSSASKKSARRFSISTKTSALTASNEWSLLLMVDFLPHNCEVVLYMMHILRWQGNAAKNKMTRPFFGASAFLDASGNARKEGKSIGRSGYRLLPVALQHQVH